MSLKPSLRRWDRVVAALTWSSVSVWMVNALRLTIVWRMVAAWGWLTLDSRMFAISDMCAGVVTTGSPFSIIWSICWAACLISVSWLWSLRRGLRIAWMKTLLSMKVIPRHL